MIFSYSASYAHGDLHQRILECTEQLKKDPNNLALYMKRGKLYLEHEEYDKCIKDLKKCREGNFSDRNWLIYEARSYYALQEYENGLESISEFISTDSKHVRALRIRGNILLSYGCYNAAAMDLEKVINYSVKTLPENYLECAAAYLNSERENNVESANRILELGINHLGNIPVLYDRLVSLNLNYGNLKEAIKYQTEIVNMMNRKENALYKRAMLYLESGNKKLAIADLEMAKAAFENLPDRIRSNSSSRQLISEINQKLSAL